MKGLRLEWSHRFLVDRYLPYQLYIHINEDSRRANTGVCQDVVLLEQGTLFGVGVNKNTHVVWIPEFDKLQFLNVAEGAAMV